MNSDALAPSYIVYKTVNLINQMIYIGTHICNKNKQCQLKNGECRYLGSGIKIERDIKEFGRHNFKKTIIAIFNNMSEMLSLEAEIVNKDFIKRSDVYNVVTGGRGRQNHGFVAVKNENGNIEFVSVKDPRYINKSLQFILKGKVVVKDKLGNISCVSKDNSSYLSGELVHIRKGLIASNETKDKQRNSMIGRKHTPQALLNMRNAHLGKPGKKHSEESNLRQSLRMSKEGNYFYGKKHSEESKNKMRLRKIGRILNQDIRNKISQSNKGRISPMKGKKHSEESKNKIRKYKHSEETLKKMRGRIPWNKGNKKIIL